MSIFTVFHDYGCIYGCVAHVYDILQICVVLGHISFNYSHSVSDIDRFNVLEFFFFFFFLLLQYLASKYCEPHST